MTSHFRIGGAAATSDDEFTVLRGQFLIVRTSTRCSFTVIAIYYATSKTRVAEKGKTREDSAR